MFNADRIASLSLDGYNGLIAAFYPSLHTIRPHKGQIETAKNIRTFLEGSEIVAQTKTHVQDPMLLLNQTGFNQIFIQDYSFTN